MTGRILKSLVMMIVLAAGLCLAPRYSSAAIRQADSEAFAKANSLYREGKFDESARIYRDLARKYPDAAPFAFDLGNALFRLHRLGEARLAYEKAKLDDPRNADIRYNLEYVKGLVPYRVEDKRNWYIRAGERALEHFREKEVYFIAMIVFLLFAACWNWHLYTRHEIYWGRGGKIFGILLLLLIPLAVAKNIEADVMKDAIVLAKEAEVRYGPSSSDQVAFRVGEGIKVYVNDSRDEWSRIVLVNGESGWIQNSQIALVQEKFPEESENRS